ncbi:MAG: 23S rRNA (pseudouridine(1915)-N(3))-methyltransferase RlmH [Bacillota bacterium]|jgi:23S rRNA (pseudouridine1915-N3)-methyltransferase
MQFTIIAVGNLREKHWQAAAAEYLKRLRPYAKVKVIEIGEERVRDEGSPALIEQALRREAERIEKALPAGGSLIALDVQGRGMSSEELAAHLEQAENLGRGQFTFLIGGSYGLHQSLLEQAALRLSFSQFTFPHQLMRVILLEQLYRAMKIIRREAYHK